MKTQCLQANEMQHCLGKEKPLGLKIKVLAFIKSLIYVRVEKMSLWQYERLIKIDQICDLILDYSN